MVDYSDFENSWMFTENGDLKITEDYVQSINNRIKCPAGFLDIYYEEYGSDIPNWIGEEYDEDMIRYSIEETFKQDEQIQEYSINNISYVNNIVSINVTIDDIEMIIQLNEEEEEETVDEDEDEDEDEEGVLEW